MKQMSLIEMDGFLKGKCIPRDLKVNETNAEYLVRKFAEAEAKILALAEDQQKAIESIKQADSAVKLAHEKFSALAAENVALKNPDNWLSLSEYGDKAAEVASGNGASEYEALRVGLIAIINRIETPATDRIVAGIEADGVEEFVRRLHQCVDGGDYVDYEDHAEIEAKCSALAAENARLKSGAMDEIKVINRGGQAYCVKDGVQVNPMYARGWNDYRAKSMQSDTPATDAFLTEVRAKAFDDLCAAFVKHASVSGLDDGDCVTVKEATDALLHCAEQLHKGVHS